MQATPGGNMADVKEFLNPNGTLTPGIAGGLAIAISLPVAINFGISVKWIALVVSFLLGSVIILSFRDPISRLLRFVYWVLDSLIIFAMAVGVGFNIDSPPAPPSPPPAQIQHLLKGERLVPAPSRIAAASLVFAQPVAQPTPPAAAPETGRPKPTPEPPRRATEEKELTKEQIEAVKKYLQQQEQYQQKQQEYQKRWSW